MALLHVISIWSGTVTSTTGTGQTLYTVPAGQRVTIKNLQLRNLATSGTPGFLLYVNGNLVWSRTFAASEPFQYSMWLNLNPGDVLSAKFGTSTGCGLAVSGSIYNI